MLSEILDRLRVIFCFCVTWSLIIYFILTAKNTFQEGIKRLKRLHQIPCSRCNYFTNDYRLKCTVNPTNALSEEAIGCIDFEAGSCNMSGAKRCPKKNQFFLVIDQGI